MAGFGSAFVDNIPLTAMMIKIVEDLSPLIFSMAFAVGLGGKYVTISTSVFCIVFKRLPIERSTNN